MMCAGSGISALNLMVLVVQKLVLCVTHTDGSGGIVMVKPQPGGHMVIFHL